MSDEVRKKAIANFVVWKSSPVFHPKQQLFVRQDWSGPGACTIAMVNPGDGNFTGTVVNSSLKTKKVKAPRTVTSTFLYTTIQSNNYFSRYARIIQAVFSFFSIISSRKFVVPASSVSSSFSSCSMSLRISRINVSLS